MTSCIVRLGEKREKEGKRGKDDRKIFPRLPCAGKERGGKRGKAHKIKREINNNH